MIDTPKITHVAPGPVGEYEPGNGTRYTAVAVWWPGPGIAVGVLGEVTNGWLVTSGNTGRSHLFQMCGLLTDEYIREKLGGNDWDYPYFGDLVRMLIGRGNWEPPHSDLDTIDLEHDQGLRDLTDPWQR